MAELRTIVKPGEQLKVYAISVDAPAQSKQFAEKISADGNGSINYPILSDAGHRLIDAFGIRDPAYNGQQFEGIPYPAVYVIDKDGRVAWSRLEKDYKERPINDEVRSALKNLKMI